MNQADMQLTWDRALIDAWRKAKPVWVAMVTWEEATGKRFYDHDKDMKRVPNYGFPRGIGTRVFVANFLPKVSERLWNQKPEVDEALIAKLQTTNYDTVKNAVATKNDRELVHQGRKTRRSMAKVALGAKIYSERNHNTDWNVTKASARKTR
jgi:hypothetical protein